jgi:hypothetical protein
MKQMTIAICAVAILAPAAAMAESRYKPVDKPGHSEYAPGQRADEAGNAKNFAPGQLRKKKDDPNSPGASEYAPGHRSDRKYANPKK